MHGGGRLWEGEVTGDGKNVISGHGGTDEVETERDVYRGGSRATGVTNVGGGDGGAQLTVALLPPPYVPVMCFSQ